jgi:hypothetical protein
MVNDISEGRFFAFVTGTDVTDGLPRRSSVSLTFFWSRLLLAGILRREYSIIRSPRGSFANKMSEGEGEAVVQGVQPLKIVAVQRERK